MKENKLLAGFARVNITPPMGIPVSGYFVPRFAEGVLDELEIQALAVSDGENRALIMVADLVGLKADQLWEYRRSVSEATGVPAEAIFIACTHTHTGPVVLRDELEKNHPAFLYYLTLLQARFADAAICALQDLKPAEMGYAVGEAPNIAFVRRFRMKDGKVRTNPGVGNPDILAPLGDVDERVNVLRFARENAEDLVLVNFGVHPDTIGGSRISADYPRFVRETVEAALPDTRCLFLNGAQGDVNHVNVNAKGGDKNGLVPMFDDCDRGYDHAKHMGRTIAGAVLQVFGKVNFTPVEKIAFGNRIASVPSHRPDPKDLPLAREYAALHKAGKDSQIPYQGMELTTVVAEALRMLRLENGPDAFELPLTSVAIGPVALIGIPGEPFTGIGRGLKDASPFALTLPCCAAGGYEGYFPMQDAYDEGGYEARSSRFRAGVAERLIENGSALLSEVYEQK